MDVTVYQCPNCGGEITATHLAAMETCSYCGRPMIPKELKGTEDMPQEVIPFQITKEQCKEYYRKHLKRYFAIPSKMKNEAFLENFRPVYVPYWSFDIDFAKKPKIPLSHSYRKGDYVYTEHYTVTGDMDASAENVLYDASSQLHDVIGQYVMPFRSESRREFNPSYLFGFFADRADTVPDLYEPEAREEATQEIFRKLDRAVPDENIRMDTSRSSRSEWEVGTTTKGAKCIMLPMWFLTWREKDQVAYAVVNGETGKVYSDMPLSTGKFLLTAGLAAAALFALIRFVLPTFSIYTALQFSSIAAVLSLILYYIGTRDIRKMKRHEDDKGYLSVMGEDTQKPPEAPPPKKKKASKSKGKKKNRGLSCLSTIAMIYSCFMCMSMIVGVMGFLSRLFSLGTRYGRRTLVYVIIAIVTAIVLALLLRKKNRDFFLPDILGSVTALIAAIVIHFVNPANDMWYYGAMLLSAAGVLWTLLSLIRQYNDIATHPEPHFFKGEGS